MEPRGYSAEQWAAWIEEQRDSRLTIAAFCVSIGVTENSLHVWRRKLRSDRVAASRPGKLSAEPREWMSPTLNPASLPGRQHNVPHLKHTIYDNAPEECGAVQRSDLKPTKTLTLTRHEPISRDATIRHLNAIAACVAVSSKQSSVAAEHEKRTGMGLVIYDCGIRRRRMKTKDENFDLFNPANSWLFKQESSTGTSNQLGLLNWDF